MAENRPTAPQVPEKPLKVSKWLVLAAAAFVIIYLVMSLIHMPSDPAKEKGTSQPTTAPASQGDMESFNRARAQRLADIAKKRELVRKEAEEAGLGDESVLLAIVNQLPPCDKGMREKLNGQNYVAVNQQTKQIVQFSCESDDSWHPLPAAAVAAAEPPTPQQQRAIDAQGRQRSLSEGMSAKERAAQALDAALKSSSVVDFSQPSAEVAQPSSSASNVRPTPSTEPRASDAVAGTDHGVEPIPPSKSRYDWDSSTGPLYHVFEGDVIEGILTNRLAGEFTGPVSVMVTTNLYSHDRQHILMPQGTRILGESAKVGISGQRRLAVPFHRAIMPDGYSVDVDKFAGLDQQGAAGLTGRVDTHWPKVIATAVLVGAIGGLSEVGASGTSLTGLGAIRLGVTEQSGQSTAQLLDRALNMLPTITVYEGTRVRIWVQRDMQLPAWENHTVSPTL